MGQTIQDRCKLCISQILLSWKVVIKKIMVKRKPHKALPAGCYNSCRVHSKNDRANLPLALWSKGYCHCCNRIACFCVRMTQLKSRTKSTLEPVAKLETCFSHMLSIQCKPIFLSYFTKTNVQDFCIDVQKFKEIVFKLHEAVVAGKCGSTKY